jgi:hypothetical protein
VITVISTCFGGYDEIRPFPPHPDLHGVMVTDEMITSVIDKGWNSVTHRNPNMHPRLAAKVAKCRPDRFLFDSWEKRDEAVVWLDASAHICDPDYFVEAVRSVPYTTPMAQFLHPDRDCIYDELVASRGMEKYETQDLETQLVEYEKFGMPRHWGLWATGMIVYHPAAFDLPAFGNAWLVEQMKWTYQDQLSEPYLLWVAEYRPASLPGNLRQNGYVEWQPHTRNN